MPEGVCSYQSLFFAHEDHVGSVMRKRIAPGVEHLDHETLLEHARQPDERCFVERGVQHSFISAAQPDSVGAIQLILQRDRRPWTVIELETEWALGEHTEDELREWIHGI